MRGWRRARLRDSDGVEVARLYEALTPMFARIMAKRAFGSGALAHRGPLGADPFGAVRRDCWPRLIQPSAGAAPQSRCAA